MRIAHVTDCYLPRLGGIEMQVHDLAAHQLAAGHDVTVLTRTPEGDPGRGSRRAPVMSPVPVRRFPLPFAADLREALVTGGFDVVHAHSSLVSPLAWTGARTAGAAGVPTVVTLHSLLPTPSDLLDVGAAVTGWTRWPVRWTAVSAVAAGPLRAALGDARVDVLPNGVDVDHWRLGVPRADRRTVTVTSVMRLNRRKRPRALLRILAAVRAQLPQHLDLRAVIVGDGPLRPALERYLHRTGMDAWVTLTGALDRPRVREVLFASDVYLAPARQESFGIAALEARCTGLPVVAMASGGVGEFVRSGADGFLVASDDEMARVTADLLASPALREMQESSRTSVPDLDWPTVLDRTTDCYRRAGARVTAAAGPAAPAAARHPVAA